MRRTRFALTHIYSDPSLDVRKGNSWLSGSLSNRALPASTSKILFSLTFVRATAGQFIYKCFGLSFLCLFTEINV